MRLWGLIALIGLTGCSSDEEPQTSVPVELTGFVTEYEEAQQAARAGETGETEANEATGTSGASGATGMTEAAGLTEELGIVTRAWDPPTGFSRQDVRDQVIGISFTQDESTPFTKMGQFFYTTSWRTNVELTEGTYYLYGYAPHTTGISYSIAPGAEDKYKNGAVMTLENVPSVTSNDLCVIVGAKNGKESVNPATTYSIPGLVRGDFSYKAKAITSGNGATGKGNYVFLLFDHLYAALRINMKVDETYNALRTIKLKDFKLQTSSDGGQTLTKTKTNITITLTANDTGADPITSITFEPHGDEDGVETLFRSSTGKELGTTPTTFNSHFMPQGINTLILTSVYDVYDKNGNLIRENCEATNTCLIKDVFYQQNIAHRKTKYILNLIIRPTFLYVLSDPDLDNPRMEVNKNE